MASPRALSLGFGWFCGPVACIAWIACIASTQAQPARGAVPVKLLSWNDFHGQLAPRTSGGRPIGGAVALAAYLKAAARGAPHVFYVHAGDQVGASPPSAALSQDEPSIAFLNLLANDACKRGRGAQPRCNLIGTLGNHEFDEGEAELMRLLRGGNHAAGPFLEKPWRGARFPNVCANVVHAATGKPLLPPYVVQRAGGIPIAFIGAVLHSTPSVVLPSGVAQLTFQNEADAINRYIPELRAAGVRTIVLLVHQGLIQEPYEGPTRTAGPAPRGALLEVIHALDSEIDVVVSGHTHEFTNALVPNASGAMMLVTSAVAGGTAYGEIDLMIDRKTRDVVSKTARIVPTWADEGPALTSDPRVARLVEQAARHVAPKVQVVVGTAAGAIRRAKNEAGESALGNLVADSQRAAMKTDFAVINPGGIRADLEAGTITWGQVFTAQPFRNRVVAHSFTGQQIVDLLDQQWGGEQPAGGRILGISGFSYTWDPAVPEGGKRVTEVRTPRGPISRTERYTLAANGFLAEGGDNFSVFKSGVAPRAGPLDLDALVDYIRTAPQPIAAEIDGRIKQVQRTQRAGAGAPK